MQFKIFDFLSRKVDRAELATIGMELGTSAAFKNLAMHIAISYIANTLSKCEIKVYKDGEETKDELYYMLNVNPNPNQNSSQFMNKLLEEYFYKGEALVVPYKNFIYVSDGFMRDERPLAEDIFDSIGIENETLQREYKSSEVFYFKLDNKDVAALISSLYGEYGQLIAAAIQSFKANNKEQYKLILENYQAGDKAFAKTFNEVIKQQLDAFLNSDRAVYPEFRGQTLERMQGAGSSSSADVVALRKEIFEVTAQAFKIPQSMMLGNITNMNEIVKVYLSICIDPIAQMISEEFTRKMFPFQEWKLGNKIVVDTSCINHIDMLEVADKADKLIASGTANRDEVRKRLGLDELNTDSSQAYYITKNYEPADNSLNPAEGGEPIAETD
jgi:HK97 family phage portal protein